MSKLKDELRELVLVQNIKGMDALTAEAMGVLTAAYMDDLSISDQLDMVVEPDPQKVLVNLKSALRGEGAGAYKLMDPRNLLSHDIMLGAIRWAYTEIELALEDVLSEVYEDKGVY